VTTKVEKSVVVDLPLNTVYNQWTRFEEFPEFMGAVEQVTQLSDDRLEWVAELGGVRRQWVAKILEQVPDRKVAWAAVEGATNAGEVTFSAIAPSQTEVHLSMEYEPEGFVEKVGEFLNIIATQAEDDLENFKRFVERSGAAVTGWRGSINEGADLDTPGIADAASSLGDRGKVGDAGEREAAYRDDDPLVGLTDTTPVGEPPAPGDHGLNPTDAASGFGQDQPGTEPGVVRPDQRS
jgi:ribosome-associated toxin RatA of RatAB toxin-antitoxin module